MCFGLPPAEPGRQGADGEEGAHQRRAVDVHVARGGQRGRGRRRYVDLVTLPDLVIAHELVEQRAFVRPAVRTPVAVPRRGDGTEVGQADERGPTQDRSERRVAPIAQVSGHIRLRLRVPHEGGSAALKQARSPLEESFTFAGCERFFMNHSANRASGRAKIGGAREKRMYVSSRAILRLP